MMPGVLDWWNEAALPQEVGRAFKDTDFAGFTLARSTPCRRRRRDEPLALMPALDTSALVRYVVEDDVTQLAAARRLIRKRVGEGQTLFVPVTVTLELEWVLRSSFEYAKDEVMQVLSFRRGACG